MELPELGTPEYRDWLEILKQDILRQQLGEDLLLDIGKRKLYYQPNEDFKAILDPSKLNLRGRLGKTEMEGTYNFDGAFDLGMNNPFLGGNLSLRYAQTPDRRNLGLQYQRNF